MKPLQGKTALVTGGSRGIGASIVRQFASVGADVAFTYSSSGVTADALAEELGQLGVQVRAYRADAADPESLPIMIDRIINDFSHIDILVNNVGVGGRGMIGDVGFAAYRRVMTINVDAVFITTQAVLKGMPDDGRIINIGSVLGERATFPGIGVYNASKFAVAGLTRSWAKDLAPRNILVNIIQSGPINTDMNPEDSERADSMRSTTALGRYGQPDEIAAVATFLAGPGASYMAGATINVDGGWNA
jgi:3-oxoacyl-[acyl-carrier protein] reductase